METHWYTVCTRPRCEKKVAALLTEKGIETYCPLNKVVKQWSDRRKTVEEPLFTSYVFVRINEQQQPEVKQINGVSGFVHHSGTAAKLSNNEIKAIKEFLSRHRYVWLEKTSPGLNNSVKVIEFRANEVNSRTAKMELPSLGYILLAIPEVRPVEANPQKTYICITEK